jgi:hypothetical protein
MDEHFGRMNVFKSYHGSNSLLMMEYDEILQNFNPGHKLIKAAHDFNNKILLKDKSNLLGSKEITFEKENFMSLEKVPANFRKINTTGS